MLTVHQSPLLEGFDRPGHSAFQEQELRSKDKAFRSDSGPLVVAWRAQGAEILGRCLGFRLASRLPV